MSQSPNSKRQLLIKLREFYQALINESKHSIDKLIAQNLYIDNQLKQIHLHPITPISLPPYNHFPPQTIQYYLPTDTYSPNSLSPNQSTRLQTLQAIRNAASQQKPNSKSPHQPNTPHEPQTTSLNSIKTQAPLRQDETPNLTRKSYSGRLEDIPGNPIENRLVTEFFTTEFPKFITVDGQKQSQLNKKQLLAFYISWRLGVLPQQTKIKLIATQVLISKYIHLHLKQCQNLRHTYNGMTFKSFQIIKQLKKINLNKYRMEEKRGGRRKRWTWGTGKKMEDGDDDSAQIQEEEDRLKAQEGEGKYKKSKRYNRDSEWRLDEFEDSNEEKTSIVSQN